MFASKRVDGSSDIGKRLTRANILVPQLTSCLQVLWASPTLYLNPLSLRTCNLEFTCLKKYQNNHPLSLKELFSLRNW